LALLLALTKQEASRFRRSDGVDLCIVAGGDSEEAALLARAGAGDREALGSLLQAHYDRCYAVCRRILASEEDARDATQEAMIAIARGIAKFDGRSAFSTWCYRVATNAALDELRRRRRRPQPGVEDISTADGRFAELPSSQEGVSGPVTDRVAVAQALARLPEEQRVAVVLRDIADLDYAEIGEVLGIPLGTVRSRIFRARAALAEALRERREPKTVTQTQRNRPGTAHVEGHEVSS